MDGPQAPVPRKVGVKGQVQLPPELMTELGIEPKQPVWIGVNPERPGTLIVIPDALYNEIWRKGFTSLA